MRAVRLDEVGPPENLKIVERPIPEPGDDDVLIKVEYAGLIYGDAEARRGTYSVPTTLPWYPGRDVVGIVERVGKNVTGIEPGQRVMALLLHGTGCAEYALAWTRPKMVGGQLIRNGDVIPIPAHVKSSMALVYLINFRMAWFLFDISARVARGARILIHGAAGGMGSMITQLARARGCEIIAGCRTTEEAAFCRENGADHVINVATTDYVQAVTDLTSGKGVQFSFNGVGGSTIQTDWKVVAPFGEILLYGYTAGKPPLQVFDIHKTVTLKTFEGNNFLQVPQYAEAARAAMLEWLETGPLLDVSRVFPLEDVATAHRWLDEGRVIGKIALKP